MAKVADMTFFSKSVAAEAEAMMTDFNDTMQAVREGQMQSHLLRSLGIGAEDDMEFNSCPTGTGEILSLEVCDLVSVPCHGRREKAVVLEIRPNTALVQFIGGPHRAEISRREIELISHLQFYPAPRDDGSIGFRAQAYISAPPTPAAVEKPSYLPTQRPPRKSRVSKVQEQILTHWPAPRPTETSGINAGTKSLWSSENAVQGGHFFSQLYSNNFYSKTVTDDGAGAADNTRPAGPSTPFVRRTVVTLDGTEKTWGGQQLSHWISEPYDA